MLHTPTRPFAATPNPATPLRPRRLLKQAGNALAALADTEWFTERYPRYGLVPVSLATGPAPHSSRQRRRPPAGLDPMHPLMGPHPTD